MFKIFCVVSFCSLRQLQNFQAISISKIMVCWMVNTRKEGKRRSECIAVKCKVLLHGKDCPDIIISMSIEDIRVPPHRCYSGDGTRGSGEEPKMSPDSP